MSSFLVSLWESIFTPGPTPTLLLATNAAFGALQFLLFLLLLATNSIHFIILSGLCAGLWYAINWFARELEVAKANDTAANTGKDGEKDKVDGGGGSGGRRKDRKSPEPASSDTETETTRGGAGIGKSTGMSLSKKSKAAPNPIQRGVDGVSESDESPATDFASASSSGFLVPQPVAKGLGENNMLRRRSLGDSSGYVSTDSEWEKVSEGEGKK